MHRLASVFLLALAAPLTAAADTTIRCGAEVPVAGDGQKVTQVRPTGAFAAVRLEGSLDVEVQVGPPAAVAVTIDENLQPRVETRLDGDTLVITSRSMRYRGEAKVSVATPALRAFDLEGSGRVTIRDGAGDTTLTLSGSGDLDWKGRAGALAVELAGSGAVRLDGLARALRVELNGSGDVKAARLTATDAEVEINGSGDVELTLDGGALSAEISGSGDVRWGGAVRSERSTVNGSGRISHR
jgi:uncharacterized protein (AIM24 family)